MPKLKDMTLEEKVDELLKYQRRIHHMAVLKTIFSFLTFFVIVLLPIIAFFYVGDVITGAIGLSLTEIGEVLRKVKSITDIDGVESLKNFLN